MTGLKKDKFLKKINYHKSLLWRSFPQIPHRGAGRCRAHINPVVVFARHVDKLDVRCYKRSREGR